MEYTKYFHRNNLKCKFNLEWGNDSDLKEILELQHKGIPNYPSEMCIESKVCHIAKKYEFPCKAENNDESNLKKIILNNYDSIYNTIGFPKYKVILPLLREILALNDANLVEKYAQQIIDLLIETGVSNNVQWFDIYYNLNVNSTAASKFGKLIAPHLNLKSFTIKDTDVKVLSSLLQYININAVDFDISSEYCKDCTDCTFSNLINILRIKKCKLNIKDLNDDQFDFWTSVITPVDNFEINNVVLKNEKNNLSLLTYCNSIDDCRLQYIWRSLPYAAPDMSRCEVNDLYTVVNTIEDLPISVKRLRLGLLKDSATGAALDPGLSRITNACPQLTSLGVHIMAGTSTEHLFPLPCDIQDGTCLYLSNLSDQHHIQWAADTVKRMQPPWSGYLHLYLPSCRLNVDQLCELISQLAAAGVIMKWQGAVWVSSNHSVRDMHKLRDVTTRNLDCGLYWKQDDDELSRVPYGLSW